MTMINQDRVNQRILLNYPATGTITSATFAEHAISASWAPGASSVSASFATTASFAISASWAPGGSTPTWDSVTNKPVGLLSSSVQVNAILDADGVLSSSAQVQFNSISGRPAGLVSSSAQVNYTGISNVPAGIVSSSAQATSWTVATASVATSASFAQNALSASWAPGGGSPTWASISGIPVGLVSSSIQAASWSVATASLANAVQFANIVNRPTLVSSSAQISYAGITNIPAGILSSSTQINQLSNVSASYAATALSASWAPGTGGTVVSAATASYLSGTLEFPAGLNVPLGFTGSLLGTSSVATTAITSSYALQALSASWAPATGGGNAFPFTGSANVTGTLNVTGTINATLDIGSTLARVRTVFAQHVSASGQLSGSTLGITSVSTFGGNATFNAQVTANQQTVNTPFNGGNVSGSLAINWNNGNYQFFTLIGNVTSITFTNPVAGAIYMLEFRQDGTGGRTITGWPTMKWDGGLFTQVTGSINGVSLYTIVYTAAATYIGSRGAQVT